MFWELCNDWQRCKQFRIKLDPKAKLIHYLDESNKIKYVSVASLKFRIMMQTCKDNLNERPTGEEWNHDDIIQHQENMLNILEVQ